MIIVMKLILWRKVAVEPVLERESLKNLGVHLKPVLLTQFPTYLVSPFPSHQPSYETLQCPLMKWKK